MSDKSFGVIITGDVSDIETKLSGLVGSLSELVDRIVNVDVNVNDTQLNELNTEMGQLENEIITTDVIVNDTQLTDVSTEMASLDNQSIDWAVNVNDTALDTLSTKMSGISDEILNVDVNVNDTSLSTLSSDADQAASSMQSISDAAMAANDALTTIDPTLLNEAASSAGALGDNLGAAAKEASDYSNNMQGASDSTSTLSNAASGLAALGIGAFFAEAVNGAGNFNDSWARLSVAVGEGGTAIGTVQAEWTTAITEMTDLTGRSAGTIREYIITMGTAGVTSKDILISSFSGIAGAAFITGNSIESIENAFKRVVSTGTLGTRQLVQLGLTSQDIYKATGMSVEDVSAKLQTMDTNQRAAFLGQIMNAKYGSDANEKYKQSWEHVIDVLQRTWDYLSRIIGGLILPLLIPVLETVSGVLRSVADYLAGLDGPMKIVAGAITLLVGGFVTLILTVGPLLKAWELLNIQAGLTAVRTAASTVATYAYAAASTIATAAQTAWNIAQDLGLVGLVRSVAQLAVSVVSMGA